MKYLLINSIKSGSDKYLHKAIFFLNNLSLVLIIQVSLTEWEVPI